MKDIFCHQSVPSDPTQSKLYLLLKILSIDPDCKGKVLDDFYFSVSDIFYINYKGGISIPWLLGLTCTDNVQWLRYFISTTDPDLLPKSFKANQK
ncbi:22611_t:CDS:2 [Entrophospora sp. SA101]|nr:22611_t:CDS:2 [Entrophospora sp. SA101]